MSIWLWVFFVACPARSYGESFQWELAQKKLEVKAAIGKKRLMAIEAAADSREIYRITQLFSVEDIGITSIDKISKILGYRFEYKHDNQTCYRGKWC